MYSDDSFTSATVFEICLFSGLNQPHCYGDFLSDGV